MILPLRIVLQRPPAGVHFSLQGKPGELFQKVVSTGADITFDFEIRVQPGPRFLGEFTQGPPASRFVYVCSGASAGQPNTPISRRAKLPLQSITWELAAAGKRLTARIPGTGRDGGPVCATVKPFAGWLKD
ncbi:MAG: hypothetical protein FJW30_07610 [Acidobacteria bacterium]|nr:hypothetical protein [Acidobacteriota bacterium]